MKSLPTMRFLRSIGLTALIGLLGQAATRADTLWILKTDGTSIEATTTDAKVSFINLVQTTTGSAATSFRWTQLLGYNSGAAASPTEARKIQAGLPTISGTNRAASEAAVEELATIGVPVLTPLLQFYKDTDQHEPYPLGRLFERLIPGFADHPDRTAGVIRLANGVVQRGNLADGSIKVVDSSGAKIEIPAVEIRRFAVMKASISKTFPVHSLRHCTQIEFLNAGIRTTANSKISGTTEGYVRMAFDADGWSSDADGLKVPGSPAYKSNLVDGFPFGALVGRIGATGPRWMGGKKFTKEGVGTGALYFAVNDNPHWQNNVGSFRVRVTVTNAYDTGDPQ